MAFTLFIIVGKVGQRVVTGSPSNNDNLVTIVLPAKGYDPGGLPGGATPI